MIGTAKATRAKPGFPLVVRQLRLRTLPVLDFEELTCWENVLHSLLCLENDEFDIIWKDYEQRQKAKLAKKIKPQEKVEEKIEKYGDKVVDNLEKLFASGDIGSIEETLKKYK